MILTIALGIVVGVVACYALGIALMIVFAILGAIFD